MIDFNAGIELPNPYTGVDNKSAVLMDNKLYMLKYPTPVRRRNINDVALYKNNQFSEHIGCEIFRACGFETQETSLGYFTGMEGKEKIVVGCVDFTQDGSKLYEIARLAKQIKSSDCMDSIDMVKSRIENVVYIINHSVFLKDKDYFFHRFWDMFVIDALLGNDDRHLGNWGIVVKDNVFDFAPIYDCGASLAASMEDGVMRKYLADDVFFRGEELSVKSCYSMEGKKIRYCDIFDSPPPELAEAIKRTVPKIDIGKILNIVDSVTMLSETRNAYIKRALLLRYENILAPALKKLSE